jgi:hypothetical protein
MEILNIITVSARSSNIPYIGNNILSQKANWGGNLFWNIIFDFENESFLSEDAINFLSINSNWVNYEFLPHPINKQSGGNYGKDVLIKKIEKGWIYQLDDDNELYPNFLRDISLLIKNNPNYNIYCFWQHNRYQPVEKSDLKAGVVDTAMYLFNKTASEGIDYPLYYGGDGQFLENLVNKENNSVFIYQDFLCWYNRLKINDLQNMNTDELSKLAIKYGTDKFERHGYTPIYYNLFKDFKDEKIKFLELGVLKGNSLKMWREWFSNAEITGVDIQIPDENIEGVRMIKSNTQTINICDDLNNEEFDVIIDDADHHPYQQLLTFWNMWPLLKEGGIYIIEDIQNFNEWGKHWGFLNPKIFDLRGDGGTYDSILFVFRK